MRLVGVKLRNGGHRLTPVCELAAFDFWDLLVFVGFDTAVGGRGRAGVLVSLGPVAADGHFRLRANFLAMNPGNIGLSPCRRKFLPRNRLKRRSRLLASLTVDRRTAGRSHGLHGARSRSETDVSQTPEAAIADAEAG